MYIDFDMLGRLVGYSLGLIGLILLYVSYGFHVQGVLNRIKLRKRIKSEHLRSKLLTYKAIASYHLLLQSTFVSYREQMLSRIIGLQLLCLVFFLFFFWMSTQHLLFTVFISFGFAFFVPLGVMWSRLYSIRNQSQMQLVPTTMMIYQKYEQNQRNMLFTLKEVIQSSESSMKKILGLYFIQVQKGAESRNQASQVLAHQIGAQWGRNLVNILQKSLEEGAPVSHVLRDLTVDMSEFQKRIRQAHTEGKEIIALGYMPILSIPVSLFINDWYLIRGNTYAHYFSTSLGLQVFSMTLILAIIGLFMAYIYSKPKQSL